MELGGRNRSVMICHGGLRWKGLDDGRDVTETYQPLRTDANMGSMKPKENAAPLSRVTHTHTHMLSEYTSSTKKLKLCKIPHRLRVVCSSLVLNMIPQLLSHP